jgi:hypothetical protein
MRSLLDQQGSTHICKSFAAFFASTVLPKSVANFKMRAFTGSLSVTATLTSVLRVQLTSSDLATHGDTCNTSAAVSGSHDTRDLLQTAFESAMEGRSPTLHRHR